MSCYDGARHDLGLTIYTCTDGDGLTYQQMVDYFASVSVSGVTVSGGISYSDMVNYVNAHCTTSSGYVMYDQMVDYVATHYTLTSGVIDQAQLDKIYADITSVSGRVSCWEDFFIRLNTFDDDMTFTYPTTSGVAGYYDFFYDGGNF